MEVTLSQETNRVSLCISMRSLIDLDAFSKFIDMRFLIDLNVFPYLFKCVSLFIEMRFLIYLYAFPCVFRCVLLKILLIYSDAFLLMLKRLCMARWRVSGVCACVC